MTDKNSRWVYTGKNGAFRWENPHTVNELYFPICNEAGMMSSLTPRLNGDAKVGQNAFLMLPITMEDLHNNRSGRNFWIYSDRLGAYSLTGNSARQMAQNFTDGDAGKRTVVGDFLSHTLESVDEANGIRSKIVSFCPDSDDMAELMWVQITNISGDPMEITPTTSIPVFGRSADNLRDHRHATSMMHRMTLYPYGMAVKPTMHHDERGHEPNHTSYFVLAVSGDGEVPVGQFPTVQEFIGDGGTLDWPEAVVRNLPPYEVAPNRRDGMEAVGAIRFAKTTLQPGETKDYIVISGVTDEADTILRCIQRYGTSAKIQAALEKNHAFWREQVNSIRLHSGDSDFDQWMLWVALQPSLRKIFGCSFVPHHDYGRGGRGWRDLWQDYLALILQNPDDVRQILVANFGGVRTDGSNATIILKGMGNFAADRNKISRVWMDHGVWPWFTTKLYMDQTGDMDILWERGSYWKDHQIRRAKARDNSWTAEYGNKQRTPSGEVYEGTVLEKLLVQHLVCWHNVGDHGNMKLEDADWNDQLDMAPEKGESVPFTAFYGANLISMADLLRKCGREKVSVFRELALLLGSGADAPAEKQAKLQKYFETIDHFSGETVDLDAATLAADLEAKGKAALAQVSKNEWITSKTGHSFFNGYYNNDGVAVDGDRADGIGMTLTAQTFAIMFGAASDQQIKASYEAAGAILKDPVTGGYRLTTPLGDNTWNFGRGFALIYGEKETGGMFSHMAVMFMNALYSRGFVSEGYEVLKNIYGLCSNTPKAKIYPGIPEYINSYGQGKYHYVTGSASWMLMTLLTQVYGVRGDLGDLILDPKLKKEQFAEGEACASTTFAGKKLHIVYRNPHGKDYGEYGIASITINGKEIECTENRISREVLIAACDEAVNEVCVTLA